MNPPGIIQDYRKLLTVKQVNYFLQHYLDPGRDISIGSARHLNSGEFFLHPHSVEILRSLPTTAINAFTNGLSVTEDHVLALKERGAQLSYSINDSSVTNRLSLMGGTAAHHEKALRLVDLLEKHGLAYSLWILPTRTRLENGDLENCFKQLAGLGRRFCLHMPGYTKYASKDVVRELDITVDELLQLCVIVKSNYGVDIGLENMPSIEDVHGHERYIARTLASCLDSLRTSRRVMDDERCLFLCSEAVEKMFPVMLSFAGFDRSHWRAVRSTVFGGNVTCAGLLLVEDYLIAFSEHVEQNGRRPAQIVLPRVSFDVNYEDLSMRPVADLEHETGCGVVLA